MSATIAISLHHEVTKITMVTKPMSSEETSCLALCYFRLRAALRRTAVALAEAGRGFVMKDQAAV
jgi:hypothetical protein